jgi:hypothetical protein
LGNAWILYEYPAGTSHATLASPDPSSTQLWWIRLQVEGTAMRSRVWQEGSAEPGTWQMTATDSTYTTGRPGVIVFWNGTGVMQLHAFAVAELGYSATPPAALDQEGYRWGTDDGNEAGHGWEATQDTDPASLPSETTKLLRVLVNETDGGAVAGRRLALQYKLASAGADAWRVLGE